MFHAEASVHVKQWLPNALRVPRANRAMPSAPPYRLSEQIHSPCKNNGPQIQVELSGKGVLVLAGQMPTGSVCLVACLSSYSIHLLLVISRVLFVPPQDYTLHDVGMSLSCPLVCPKAQHQVVHGKCSMKYLFKECIINKWRWKQQGQGPASHLESRLLPFIFLSYYLSVSFRQNQGPVKM